VFAKPFVAAFTHDDGVTCLARNLKHLNGLVRCTGLHQCCVHLVGPDPCLVHACPFAWPWSHLLWLWSHLLCPRPCACSCQTLLLELCSKHEAVLAGVGVRRRQHTPVGCACSAVPQEARRPHRRAGACTPHVVCCTRAAMTRIMIGARLMRKHVTNDL